MIMVRIRISGLLRGPGGGVGGGWAQQPCGEPGELVPDRDEQERHGSGGRERRLEQRQLAAVVSEDHGNTSEVESPPASRTSCARAGPSGRSWKSTKNSGSTAMEPSSPMSTLSRYERRSG